MIFQDLLTVNLKKMKTLLLLLFPILVSAQSVNLSENTSYGGNCGNGFTTEVKYN